LKYIIIIISSYLIGSFPTAYILGKLFKNIDIRSFGSGNVGATNAFRVLGKKIGSLTLIIDLLKGFFPVFFIGLIFPSDYFNLQIISGFFIIMGHIFTIFLNFKGGKGVASAAGFLFALTPVPMLFTVSVFLLVLLLSKYVSLGSIIAALSYPVFIFIWNPLIQLKIISFLLASIIVFKHKQNIVRIINGVENKIPCFRKS